MAESFLKIIADCKGSKMIALDGNYHILSQYQFKVKFFLEYSIHKAEFRIHAKIKLVLALTNLTISVFPPLDLRPEINCSDCVAGLLSNPFSTKLSLVIHWGITI